MLVALAACSSSSPTAEETNAEAQPTSTQRSSTSEPAESASLELLELGEPDWSELEEWHLGALGGITFGVRPDYVVHHDNNMITIRPRFELDRGRSLPTMVIAHVSNIFNAPFQGVEDFTNVAGFGTADPNGTAIELFDLTFDGYTFAEDQGSSDAPVYMFSAYGYRYQGSSAWQPFPHSELYLAEVPSGVVAVGYVGGNDQELAEARQIFETVAPTLRLDTPLSTEPAQPLDPLVSNNYASAPEPLQLPEDGDPILTQAFAPVEAGTYRSAHLGTPMTFTIGDGWWVQPNFPGWVVLTGTDSFGPGDRGLSFHLGPTELVATTVGPQQAGDPVDFTDLDALIEAPPPNLTVSNVETVNVGGQTATRLDLTIDPTASCTPNDPCQYAWPADLPYPAQEIGIGYTTRIWRLAELPEPITIFAQSPDPSWLSIAEEVVSTLQFN